MGRRSSLTPAQQRDAVLAVLTKRKTISEVCRELAVSEQTFHRWRNAALDGMEMALGDKTDTNAREAELAKRLAEAERTVGQLALENELLGKASRRLT
jgi:transposase-like protein